MRVLGSEEAASEMRELRSSTQSRDTASVVLWVAATLTLAPIDFPNSIRCFQVWVWNSSSVASSFTTRFLLRLESISKSFCGHFLKLLVSRFWMAMGVCGAMRRSVVLHFVSNSSKDSMSSSWWAVAGSIGSYWSATYSTFPVEPKPRKKGVRFAMTSML